MPYLLQHIIIEIKPALDYIHNEGFLKIFFNNYKNYIGDVFKKYRWKNWINVDEPKLCLDRSKWRFMVAAYLAPGGI